MDTPQLELNIYAQLRDKTQAGSGLELRESIVLETYGFFEACKVLGAFHDLAETLKKNASKKG